MKRFIAGQALVETALAVTVLGALLGSLPWVLVLHDIERTSQRVAFDSSLMAAWNGASGAEVLRRRVEETVADLPWQRPADGEPIARADASRVVVWDAAPPGRAAALLSFIAQPLNGPGNYLGDAFALTQRGFSTATTTLHSTPMSGAPAPFDALAADFTRSAASLTDAWNAGGSAMVVRRVSGLVPTRALGESSAGIEAFRGVLGVIEPSFERFCPGRIAAEDLPASRLEGASARAGARRSQGACE